MSDSIPVVPLTRANVRGKTALRGIAGKGTVQISPDVAVDVAIMAPDAGALAIVLGRLGIVADPDKHRIVHLTPADQ